MPDHPLLLPIDVTIGIVPLSTMSFFLAPWPLSILNKSAYLNFNHFRSDKLIIFLVSGFLGYGAFYWRLINPVRNPVRKF